jgi:hypothetical protein
MTPVLARIVASVSFCAAVVSATVLSVNAADVKWHILTDPLPVINFALDPAAPTTTNLISFVGPTDGDLYANSCLASVANGEPSIAVDSVFLTVQVTFSAPLTNIACPAVVVPVSGVDGQFGPLRAGNWVFTILTNVYSFSVAEVPLPLSIQTATNSSSLQLSWPVSGDRLLLEFSDSLSSANWQAVTNMPVVLNGQNFVQITRGAGSQFYRLIRLTM